MEYGNVTYLTTYAHISLNRVFAVSSVETCANEVSEYDQEIQQSQTADQPTESSGKATGHLSNNAPKRGCD